MNLESLPGSVIVERNDPRRRAQVMRVRVEGAQVWLTLRQGDTHFEERIEIVAQRFDLEANL